MEVLGSGAFGTVWKGLWKTEFRSETIYLEVAIKMSGDEVNVEDRVPFLQEAAVMGQFNHPNIVRLLAVVIHQELVTLILSFITL